MKKDILEYENAQEMAISYPETFKAPSKDDLDRLKVGDFVKVCIKIPQTVENLKKLALKIPTLVKTKKETSNINLPESERFWVKISRIENDDIEGNVYNDLIFLDLDFKDEIKFKKDNVYSIDDND